MTLLKILQNEENIVMVEICWVAPIYLKPLCISGLLS